VGTSAHGRNGRYTYYACSTRYKYGPAKCSGDRLPKDRLEAAVLTQLAEPYRDGHVIERALVDLAAVTESERPELEERLALDARGDRPRRGQAGALLRRLRRGPARSRAFPRPHPWPP